MCRYVSSFRLASGAALFLALLMLCLPLPVSAQTRCDSLREQLSNVDRGQQGALPPQYIRAIRDQQVEINAMVAEAQSLSCIENLSQDRECVRIANFVDSMRRNLRRLEREGRQASSAGSGRRESILRDMKYYGCVLPQYNSGEANNRPFTGFEDPDSDFNRNFNNLSIGRAKAPGFETYQTVCVRIADGYHFPISFATTNDRFLQDQEECLNSCTRQDVKLFAFRNPGETIEQAVSLDGQVYGELRGRNDYQNTYDPKLTCAPDSLDDSRLHSRLRSRLFSGENDTIVTEILPDLQGDSEKQQEEDLAVTNSLRKFDNFFEREYQPGNVRLVGPAFFPEDRARQTPAPETDQAGQ